MKETKYLAVDFGLKRIGVAVSDYSKTFSFSRGFILNDKSTFENLLKIILEDSVEKIVIGYPEQFSSSKTHLSSAVQNFKAGFQNFLAKKSVKCECIFFDERFTSKLAEYHIARSGLSKTKKKEKGNIDALSAQILLQDYLDKEKNTR